MNDLIKSSVYVFSRVGEFQDFQEVVSHGTAFEYYKMLKSQNPQNPGAGLRMDSPADFKSMHPLRSTQSCTDKSVLLHYIVKVPYKTLWKDSF